MSKLFALVIEDNPDIAEIFRVAFTKCDFVAEIVYDGQKALDRLAECVPDVIVVDLRLPLVPGGELLRYIHSEERLMNAVIVVTSADPRLAANYSEQADVVLIKPVTYGQLRELATTLSLSLAPR